MNRDEIFTEIRDFLIENFEIPAERITPDALLTDDLDLDSIDAVDLILKLQELTGAKLSAEQFHDVHSLGDVIEQVHGFFGEAA